MRKKQTTQTYMRGVRDWEIVLNKKEEEGYYLTIKKINKIDKPFIVKDFGRSIVFIDNGYYIVEFTPLNQFYNVRVFINKDLDVIGYYFDISRGNGVEDNIPYYDDLYLDVVYISNENNLVEVLDEDELVEALNKGMITTEEYKMARNTCVKLIEEINKNQNLFVNIDKKVLIQKYFG